MVLSDSRDTVVAKINLITPQLSANGYNFIIRMPFLLTRRLFEAIRNLQFNKFNSDTLIPGILS